MFDSPERFDSRDVAAYIAQQCRASGIAYNNTKIQKLLYCVYGVMLAWKDERICDEYPRAWTYGPVFPKVFKWIYRGKEIADYSTAVQDSQDSSNLKISVRRVLDVFGRFSASDLSGWTHKEGSPWWKVIKGEDSASWNSFIPDDYIKEYFRENVLAKR